MRYFKDNISENYSDVIYLDNLSKDILSAFSNKFSNLIYFLYKNPKAFNNLNKYVYFKSKKYKIKNIVTTNKHKKIKSFINNFDLDIYFTEKDLGDNDAEYVKNDNSIRLYGRRDEMYDIIKSYENEIKTINSKIKLFELSKNIIVESYKDVLVHELQHAYDDYRTNGKFVYHKETQDFFKNLKPDGITNKNELIKYLNMPHEYWARFSQTVSKFNEHDWGEDFLLLLKGFRKDFQGYNTLPEKTKKRLIKALYKLYELKKDKNG